MRNSLGNYICDWCSIQISYNRKAKFCNNLCRNRHQRYITNRKYHLKQQIINTKAKLARLQEEYNKEYNIMYRRNDRSGALKRYYKNRDKFNKRRREQYMDAKLSKVRKYYEEAKLLPLDLSKLWSSYGL